MAMFGSEIGSEVYIVGDRFGVLVGRLFRTIGPGSVDMVSPSNGALEQAERKRTVATFGSNASNFGSNEMKQINTGQYFLKIKLNISNNYC